MILERPAIRLLSLLIVLAPFQSAHGQARMLSAKQSLQHALHFADLYNWSDAAPEFIEAERMFVAAGDQRNALYARLGKIRANLDRGNLAETSFQLATELDTNPRLQSDKELRMFCLTLKGDIDGEIDSGAMRRDWEEVQSLARELGSTKWQYRALAQLGLAAFYEGDIETARKNVGTALAAARAAGDAGAQIRYLTALGVGLLKSKMYDQALPYFDNALKVASATPDAPYPFLAYQSKVQALLGLNQFDAAEHLNADFLTHAEQQHRPWDQGDGLAIAAQIARARKDNQRALALLKESLPLFKASGVVRELAEAESKIAELYGEAGDLSGAEQFASQAAASTQASGDLWSIPQRLQILAELKASRGEYAEADRVYDRAEVFIDSTIGNVSGVLDKTALIRSSSELYSQHFSLVAEHLNNPAKAFSIIEQVRGRVSTDLLAAGSITPEEAKKDERIISQLRLKLVSARSTADLRRIRDQIFVAEQSRWVTPELSILKARSHETVGIEQVQKLLSPSSAILEYVISEPRSYCLVITRTDSRIVPLIGKQRIDSLVAEYRKAAKAKRSARAEGRHLFDALVRPISETEHKKVLVIIPDGPLHLIPFDGLMDTSGRYVAEAHIVICEPSATSFYLLSAPWRAPQRSQHALLAVGGIPYKASDLRQATLTRGYGMNELASLPGSKDEVLVAEAAVHDPGDMLLIGSGATKSAFERAPLSHYRIIHLAVHGFADTRDPDRSALVLLSDPSTGEDGFLPASEIVQLHLNADLVVLSACDTAVGPVEGEEGVAALSRAFLLAGARGVVSTLWSIDDTYSLVLMRHFYKHLAAHEPAAYALAEAKREMLGQFGRVAVPYYWAGFTFEGVDRTISLHEEKNRYPHLAESRATRQNSDAH